MTQPARKDVRASDAVEPRVRSAGKASRRVSPLTRIVIWTRAAGHCQLPGCNKSLLGDLVAGKEDRNFGFIAHIVAEKPNGPRGDRIRSPQLVDDPKNLMLLCATHHKLIDVDFPDEFPEERLLAIKAEQERRIAIVTGIDVDRASHVLRFGAKIGSRESPLAFEHLSEAMLPDRYPAEGRQTIDIEILGVAAEDDEAGYWTVQRDNLRRQFARKVHERIEARDIRHLTVFGLAPQPLLIELGHLLGDILAVDVRQLHREPKGWRWASDTAPIALHLGEGAGDGKEVALVVALSASMDPSRAQDALGKDVPLWTITADDPHNDIIRDLDDLAAFRKLMRKAFDAIKIKHGEGAVIHLFPAVPVSAAVEIGRVWMPKADLPLILWDQNRKLGGFHRTFAIGSNDGRTPE